MQEFLEFLYDNGINSNPYKVRKMVSFGQLKEEGGYSQKEIFTQIEEALQKGLVYTENEGEDIYRQKKVGLNSKGEFYVEAIKNN